MSKEEVIKIMKEIGIKLIYGVDHSKPMSFLHGEDCPPIQGIDPSEYKSYMGIPLDSITKEDWDNG